MAASTNPTNYLSLNGQDYHCLVELDNGIKKVSFNANVLHGLIIQENFLEWFVSGVLILNNGYEFIERVPYPNNNAPIAKLAEDTQYKFRTDGRDVLTIKIMPDINSKAGNDPSEIELDNQWEIYFQAIIHEIEDVPGKTPEDKLKKLHFLEKEYYLMLEKNIEFSTSDIVEKTSPHIFLEKLTNDERSIPTGTALLEYLKSIEELKEKVDEVGWSIGSPDNKIFYTSPSDSKVIDDIDYITLRHTSEKANDYDVAFLHFERRADPNSTKKFTFKPLQYYYETIANNPDWIEEFKIQEPSESFGEGIVLKKSNPGSIAAKEHSEIQTYEFVEMSGQDSSTEINPKAIYNYNRVAGQWNLHINDNTPDVAKKYTEQHYLPHVTGKSLRLQLNEWKKDGHNIEPMYVNRETNTGTYAYGRNRLITSSLFNGTAINITTRGLTFRQPGKFFTINKLQYNDTDFDNRLEGEYLNVSTIHNFNFKNSDYINEILGVKLHYYESKEDIPEDDSSLIV